MDMQLDISMKTQDYIANISTEHSRMEVFLSIYLA